MERFESNGNSLAASSARTSRIAVYDARAPSFNSEDRGALMGLVVVIAGLHVVAGLLLLIAHAVA